MGWFGKKDEYKRRAVPEPLDDPVGPYIVAPMDAPLAVNQYVAPNLVPPATQAPISQLPASHKPVDLDEEDTVVVERHQEMENDYDVENPTSTSYSRNGESEPEQRTYEHSSKHTHLNSLFNGHLMKWKFEAEEGTSFLRVPACTCQNEGDSKIRRHLMASRFYTSPTSPSFWSHWAHGNGDCGRRVVPGCLGTEIHRNDCLCSHHVTFHYYLGRTLCCA
jgi:hypothetical protein